LGSEKNGVYGLKRFTAVSIAFIDHSIQANQKNKLYQSYNLMSVNSDKVIVSNLSEMLEGQVAVLSSGYLDGKASLEIIDALRRCFVRPIKTVISCIQIRNCLSFRKKNNIPEATVEKIKFIKLLANSNNSLISKRC
jgi:3-dehydroquinate dehydratase